MEGSSDPSFFMRYLWHPLTIFNLMLIGTLGFIELLHVQAHRTYELDVHGHARQFCRANPETCESFLSDY
jgi:hypothetical protein